MAENVKRVFYDDIRYRKSLARASRYVKNGSRTKYVSLPSDGMTHAEWKRRNGKMESYNLSKPMKWAEFNEMSGELRQEYIDTLESRFAVNAAHMAEMFGISPATLSIRFKRDGIRTCQRGRMSNAEIERFMGWVENGGEPETRQEVQEETVKPEAPEEKKVEAQKELSVQRLGGSMTLVGAASAVLETIYQAIGTGKIKATVTWEYES